MEEIAAGQLEGPHRGDPGLKKSTTDVSKDDTYIVSSPGDGNILSRVNSLLSGAHNLSRPSGHDGGSGVHLVVVAETSRRKGLWGEEEQKKPPPSHIFFHEDRSKEIS